MKFFVIFFLLILSSCVSFKPTYNYFVECEKGNVKFSDLSSCAFEKIEKDCKENQDCKSDSERFLKIIKRLQLMVDNEEITENEAMFRYLNLVDFEESKFKTEKNRDVRNHSYYFDSFYLRHLPACYYQGAGFCY